MTLDRRTELQRIAAGFITGATLAGNSSYLITNFTVGADQSNSDGVVVVEWQAPTLDSNIPRRAVYDQLLNGRRRGQGFTKGSLVFSYLTFDMMGTFAALYSDPDESAAVTFCVGDAVNALTYYHGYLNPFNEWAAAAKAVPGGYSGVSIPYDGATEIAGP